MNQYETAQAEIVPFEGFGLELSDIGNYLTNALQSGAQSAAGSLLSNVASTPDVQTALAQQAQQTANATLAQKLTDAENQAAAFAKKNQTMIYMVLGGITAVSLGLFIFSRKRRR